MWRFLLAGFVAVGGITALFVASFGDPVATFQSSLPQTLPVTVRPSPSAPQFQESTPSNDLTAEKNDSLRLQIEELQKQMTQAQEQAATQLATTQQAAAQLSAQPNVQQPDTAQQQNDNMRKQVQELQVQLAQATANVDKVHAQIVAMTRDADLARQALTAMRRAKEDEAARRAKEEEAAKQRAKEEEEAKQREAVPKVEKIKKPPPPPKDSREAMLARLRSRFVDADELRTPEMADASPPPRQRLMDARAAVVDGRITDAERLLQQAQTQMVLQPVSPSQDASTSNPAAGRIAQALSMLDASDLPRALYYIDMTITQMDRSLPPR